MARKQMFAEGTRNHILEVASRLFFEKGFDGVSVRGLMKQVGADPGGFYYYFESKEALWEEVLQAFFAPYLKEADRLAEEAQERPYRALTRFLLLSAGLHPVFPPGAGRPHLSRRSSVHSGTDAAAAGALSGTDPEKHHRPRRPAHDGAAAADGVPGSRHRQCDPAPALRVDGKLRAGTAGYSLPPFGPDGGFRTGDAPIERL